MGADKEQGEVVKQKTNKKKKGKGFLHLLFSNFHLGKEKKKRQNCLFCSLVPLLHQLNNLRMHRNTCNYFLTINCYLATGSFSRDGRGERGGGRMDGWRTRDLYSIPTASSLDWMQQCIDNTEPKWKVQPELNAHTEQRGERSEGGGEEGMGLCLWGGGYRLQYIGWRE